MKEIWKPITGREGLYSVSNLGRVKSHKRIVNSGLGKREVKESIRKTSKSSMGYHRLSVCSKVQYIHRLVANEFCEHTQGCNIVHHKDHDRSNNRADNLEWVNSSFNNTH